MIIATISASEIFSLKRRRILLFSNGSILEGLKIVPAGLIAIGQMTFVRCDVAGETACDRPHSARIQRLKQGRMGYQPGDAPITIQEGMYPEQPVVSGRHGDDAIDST